MANVPITSLPIAVAVDGSPYLEIAINTAPIGMPASYVSKRVTMQQVANQFANNLYCEVPYVCDECGTPLTTGVNKKHTSSLTEQEETEAAALQNMADWIKFIRARSNQLEVSLPVDFTNDAHWA